MRQVLQPFYSVERSLRCRIPYRLLVLAEHANSVQIVRFPQFYLRVGPACVALPRPIVYALFQGFYDIDTVVSIRRSSVFYDSRCQTQHLLSDILQWVAIAVVMPSKYEISWF